MTINVCNQSDIGTQVNSAVICIKRDKELNTREEINIHTKLAFTQSSNAIICYICGKKWPTSKQLKAHLNAHNFKQCPYCFKMLKNHAHYNKHVGNHLKLDKEVTNVKIDFVTQSTDGLKAKLINDSNCANGVKFTEVYNTSQSNSFLVSNEENLYNVIIEDKNILDENNTSHIINLYDTKTTTDYIDKGVITNDLKTLKQLAYKAYYNRLTKKTVIDEIGINNTGLINSTNLNKKLDTSIDICKPKHCKDNFLSHTDEEFHSICNNIQNTLLHINNMDIIETVDNCNSKKNPKNKLKKYYLCEHYPYRSITKPNFEAHYNKIHLNIRPYACEICLKRFYRKSNLHEHILTHNKIKNITCEVCGRNFASKKTLETHLKIHSGVKSFHCDICNVYFFHKNHLNEHIKRNHMAKLVCCMFCEKKYGLRKDLNRHVAKVHRVASYHIL